ncbi:MAG: hypothetical protein AAGD09_03250 [Cyanobacteria bacterium P01_F01_bin.56]
MGFQDRVLGGTVEQISDTASHTGPYYSLIASANGCTFSTTGLENNISSFEVAAGGVIMFGKKPAQSIQLSAGECIASKV